MDTQFKLGDCVQLKYSGQKINLVIDQIFTYQGDLRAVVRWYNPVSGKFEKEAFTPPSISMFFVNLAE